MSDDIRDREFVCNLEKCKGACCVEGDSGAPLDADELQILEDIYPHVKPYLTPKGIKAIEKQTLRIDAFSISRSLALDYMGLAFNKLSMDMDCGMITAPSRNRSRPVYTIFSPTFIPLWIR